MLVVGYGFGPNNWISRVSGVGMQELGGVLGFLQVVFGRCLFMLWVDGLTVVI